MIPLLDVNAQNHPIADELRKAFENVLSSGQFINGSEVTDFEKEAADFLQVPYAIGISSGTDAILLALMALGIGEGDEVLVPSFTFFATAGCVYRTGATPVFIDSDPVNFNLDLKSAKARLSEKTKAIIPVHLFGLSANMDEVMTFAEENELAVIEDAAQAIGAQFKGKFAGTIGHFGTYSFFPSKNLGGLGDGGLLVTDSEELADLARLFRNHGAHPKYYHKYVGGNFRLDSLQAAFLRVKLRHYAGYTTARQSNAAYYLENLGAIPGVVPADSTESASAKILLPVSEKDCTHIWNQFTLRVLGGKRDALKDHLIAQKIGCEIYYPVTLHKQECFADLPEACLGSLPVCENLAKEVLSIPIYGELTNAQQDEVISSIKAWVEAS